VASREPEPTRGLRRSALLAVPSFPKTPRYQNESYRRYVASKGCFGCGIDGWSQCAHGNGGGMGTKRSDLETFPLCATRPGHMGCHMQHDLCIDMTKDQRREIECEYVKRMQAMARADGRPEFMVAA
jgi:hypothetical protein